MEYELPKKALEALSQGDRNEAMPLEELLYICLWQFHYSLHLTNIDMLLYSYLSAMMKLIVDQNLFLIRNKHHRKANLPSM